MTEATDPMNCACGPAEAPVEWWRFVLIVFLVALSGCFSGLNLGVLGLDLKNLEMLIEKKETAAKGSQDEQEAGWAQKIYPLRKRGNLLLCAILLGNVAVNSLLSIFLSNLTSGTVGFLVSTGLIVVFGEIVPQAICQRHGLRAGAYLSYLLWVLIVMTFIFAQPIATILDCVLGAEEGEVLNKNRLKSLLDQMEKDKGVDGQEHSILKAVIELKNSVVADNSSPIEDEDKCFMLDLQTKLDRKMLETIYKRGYSRIPVYDEDRTDIKGILMTKDLILMNPDRDNPTVEQVSQILRKARTINGETNSLECLDHFILHSSHMLVVEKVIESKSDVSDPIRKAVGIITLEDIIEKLISKQVGDEHDDDEEKQEDKPGIDLKKRQDKIDTRKVQRRAAKEDVIQLFKEKKGKSALTEQELKAATQFLQEYVKPFQELKYSTVRKLVDNAQITDRKEQSFNQVRAKQKGRDRQQSHDDPEFLGHIKTKSMVHHPNFQQKHIARARRYSQEEECEIKLRRKKSSSKTREEDDIGGEGAPAKAHTNEIKPGPRPSAPMIGPNQKSEGVVQPYAPIIEIEAEKEDSDNESLRSNRESEILFEQTNPRLFERGEIADTFYLILSGHVKIETGNEKFLVSYAKFNYLGEQALEKGNYKPDFTATVQHKAKLLAITKKQYLNKFHERHLE